jgi:VWFA-related protein
MHTGMYVKTGLATLAFGACVVATGGVAAQGPGGRASVVPPAPTRQQSPTFQSSVDLVTLDVSVHNSKGQFVATLQPSDFEIYEDGVRQKIETFVLMHGGRMFFARDAAAPVATASESVFLPSARPTTDASGRVFILFIDDLHLDAAATGKTRQILKRIRDTLLHEGDMFGIVTTGTSSVSQQLTYDRQILDAAIERITGNALKPSEILNRGSWGAQGPIEVRHHARIAFETAYDLVKNLESITNRRKAVLYISSGYDFNPYERTRFEQMVEQLHTTAEALTYDAFQITRESRDTLNEADLVGELATLTRAAQRANAKFYPIDPRGLIAGQSIDDEVNPQDFQDHVRDTQTSLRVIAEETGGHAVVNQNDFDKGLRRIDAETSDYYLLGFVSSNPDRLRRTRKLQVRAPGGLTVGFPSEYSLRPSSRPK